MDSPKIPTLKDSQKPQVKLRGLGAGATLFDRIKQFKKKDLAFILAGLGTLLMAPLAEHFMMAPESGDSALNAGFGKGGNFFPGNGGSPYEPGSSGFAPGGAIGGGSDVITPLNVRDPSALVMGPGSTQQPPAGSPAAGTPPATAPASRSDSDFKDALANSARAAGSAAAKAAKVPVPKIAIAGSGLRGLGVAGGGSSAQAGMGPISAANVTNRVNVGGGMPGVRALPGYKGVARGPGQGGGGYDKAKAAADAAGSLMNQGKASSAVNDAANAAIPTGGSAFGGGGQGGPGDRDKGGPGNQDKGSKNVGESLAFLKQKKIQEKQIELWGKEREENDMFYQLAKIRNQTLASMASKWGEAMGGCIAKYPGDSCWKPKDTNEYRCTNDPGLQKELHKIPFDDVKASCKDVASGAGWAKFGNGVIRCMDGATIQNSDLKYCVVVDTTKGKTQEQKTNQWKGTNNPSHVNAKDGPASKLKEICKVIDENYLCYKDKSKCASGSDKPEIGDKGPVIDYFEKAKEKAAAIVSLRDAISGEVTGDCGAKAINITKIESKDNVPASQGIFGQQNNILLDVGDTNVDGTGKARGVIPRLEPVLNIDRAEDPEKFKQARESEMPTAAEMQGILGRIQTVSKNVEMLNPESINSKLDTVGKDALKKFYDIGFLGNEIKQKAADRDEKAVETVEAAAEQIRDSIKVSQEVQQVLNLTAGRLQTLFQGGDKGEAVKKTIALDAAVGGILSDKYKVIANKFQDQKFDDILKPVKFAQVTPARNESLVSDIAKGKSAFDKAMKEGENAYLPFEDKYKDANSKPAPELVDKVKNQFAAGVKEAVAARASVIGESADIILSLKASGLNLAGKGAESAK